ncbi:hypothetical protein, partial [Terasakiella pusilla]|uniref:hypothetical protein n=1 Tax=Terasakiella pusilla TaxID=64973 RepID=UPI003AA7E489
SHRPKHQENRPHLSPSQVFMAIFTHWNAHICLKMKQWSNLLKEISNRTKKHNLIENNKPRQN